MVATLRERKKQEVRERLVERALALFSEHGFDAVTIDQIVADADVSPRTFFRYFGSKEAVLFADQDEMLAVVRSSITERPVSEPPLTALRNALAAVVDHYASHREQHLRRARMAESGAAIATYQQAVVVPQWDDVLTEALAVRIGVSATDDLRPRLLAGVGLAALTAASHAWMGSGGLADIEPLLQQAFDALETAVDEERAR